MRLTTKLRQRIAQAVVDAHIPQVVINTPEIHEVIRLAALSELPDALLGHLKYVGWKEIR